MVVSPRHLKGEVLDGPPEANNHQLQELLVVLTGKSLLPVLSLSPFEHTVGLVLHCDVQVVHIQGVEIAEVNG